MEEKNDELFLLLSEDERSEFLRRKNILVDLLLRKQSLSEIIYHAGLILKCPIILTTNTYRVLALDDQGYEINDPVWQSAKATGYCTADCIALFESEGITHQVLSQNSAFILDYGLAQTIPRILNKILVFGKTGAYIGIFQTKRPFENIDLATTNLLCEILSIVLERDNHFLSIENEVKESILSDLLENNIKSVNILNDRLRSSSWHIKPIFQCILITPCHSARKIDNIDYLARILKGRVPDSQILSVSEGLMMLTNFQTTGYLYQYESFFKNTAETYNLFFNISSEFHSLMSLKIYYESCILVHETAKRQKLTSRITYFDNIIFQALSEKLGSDGRKIFSQSKFKKLSDYDRFNGSDYCHTLTTYIECGCSATAAASLLYIHRNTMTKRLNRISEICDINLSDGQELIHFYLTGTFI